MFDSNPPGSELDATASTSEAKGSEVSGPGASADLPSLLSDAAALLGVVAEVDVDDLDGDSLMASAEALEGLRRSLDAQSARFMHRVDVSGAAELCTGLRAKAWKAKGCNLPHGVVARELRAGALLSDFSRLGEALAGSVISIDHVHAVVGVCNTRNRAALMEVQDLIVEFASSHRFSHFRNWLAALAELCDPDGTEPDHGDHDAAAMATDGDGNLHLVMDLTGTDAVVARRIIDSECDRQYRAAVREQEATGIAVPPAQELRARAIVELLRRGADPNPRSRVGITEAVVTIPVDGDGRAINPRSSDGAALDAVDAAILVCDALLQPVGVGPTGDPLNVGRRSRLFNATQRTALAVRDGGCVFPGCDQPVSRCDAHHLVAWEQGGGTDMDNAALLCRRHHRLEHSNKPWKLTRSSADELPPHLVELHRQRTGRARAAPSRAGGRDACEGDSASDCDGACEGDGASDGEEERAGETIRIWTGPDDQLFLAQIASDHHGPAPPTIDTLPQSRA